MLLCQKYHRPLFKTLIQFRGKVYMNQQFEKNASI